MLFDDFLELIVFLTNMFVWLEKKIKAVNWKIKYYLLFNMAATGNNSCWFVEILK